VIDFGEPGGFGIRFNSASVWDITYSIHRGVDLYQDKETLAAVRQRMMQVDNSWQSSAGKYINLYQSI